MPLNLTVFAVTPFRQNCSLLWDEESKEAVWIDVGGDVPQLLEEAAKLSVQLKAIWLTHGHLDHAGASKLGTALIYILIAAIGMQIQLHGIFDQWRLLLVAALWLAVHIAIVFAVARFIRAPLFFLCVGSNANTGGASSAAIVATAFHPALAPVGVLLGILGYTLGTIGGYFTAEILRHIVNS